MKKGEYFGGNKNSLGRNDGQVTISHEAVLGPRGVARYVGFLMSDDQYCEEFLQQPSGEKIVWVYGASGESDPDHRSVSSMVHCFIQNDESCDLVYEDLTTGGKVTKRLVGSEFITNPRRHVISYDWLMSFVDKEHRVWVDMIDNSRNNSVRGSKLMTIVVTVETAEGTESRTGVIADDNRLEDFLAR